MPEKVNGKHIKLFIKRVPSMYYCSVKLTSNCTQRCLQCSIPEQADDSFISCEDFESIIKNLRAYGTRRITLTGGEPAIHPELEQLFIILQKHGFSHTNILTNLYYAPEMQDRVIDLSFKYKVQINTSYDAVDDTADEIRGAANVCETVERAMKIISSRNREQGRAFKPTATVVISGMNLKQIPQIISRLQQLGWWMNADIYRWTSENHNEVDKMKINDLALLEKTLKHIRKAPNLRTPLWIYDHLIDFISGDSKKKCPYLISPTFGSKFFVSHHGDLQVCLQGSVGNLLHQAPAEIFQSDKWQTKRREFTACPGCWNTCYTISSSIWSYLHHATIMQLWQSS